MFVPDFLVIVLRSKILSGLQGFLHFLRETIDTHYLKIIIPEALQR
jgi:hypothetical protein